MEKKDIFFKIEELLLYFYGLIFFINYEISKILLMPMVLMLFIKKIYFKENLNCGNEKMKKFFLFFLMGGIIWNFLAKYEYQAARNFFKISREIILPFYIYPIFIRDKNTLKNLLKAMLLSFLISFSQGIFEIFKNPETRINLFVGYSVVSTMGMFFALFSFGAFFEEENYKKKILYILFYIMGIILIGMSKTRAGFLGIAIGSFTIIFLKKFSIKNLLLTLTLILSVLIISPGKTLERVKTSFNIEKTKKNSSNGLRIEMWKNAIWRIRQHPILGSGTKRDDNLFKEYVNNMPEKTEVEKHYKKQLQEGGFNDAHNMYLNIVSDNGIFSIIHLIFLFGIVPYYIFKNLDVEEKIEKFLLLGISGFLSAFYFYGLVWSIWRGNWSRMAFWLCVAFLCYINNAQKK